jgi:hypothetical protein
MWMLLPSSAVTESGDLLSWARALVRKSGAIARPTIARLATNLVSFLIVPLPDFHSVMRKTHHGCLLGTKMTLSRAPRRSKQFLEVSPNSAAL